MLPLPKNNLLQMWLSLRYTSGYCNKFLSNFLSVHIIHKSKYYLELFLDFMIQKPIKSKKDVQQNTKSIQTDSDVREFYLLERLYQVMRDDKKRGKRPSAKAFYLMERLYQVMINDKNRNKKLVKS